MRPYERFYLFGFLMAGGEWIAYANHEILIGACFAVAALTLIFTGMRYFHNEQMELQNENSDT